jgi:hypothetical protein
MGSCVISIICRAPLIELVVKSRAKQPTRCVSNSVRQYPHTVCFCAESAKIIPLTVHGKSSCSYQSSIVPTTYTTRAALKWVLTQSTLRGQSIPLRYTSRFTSTRVAEEVARPGALLPQAQAQAQQPARDRPSSRSTRHYAVLGAGFAGVATAFHLLQQGSLYNPVHVQIFDPAGACVFFSCWCQSSLTKCTTLHWCTASILFTRVGAAPNIWATWPLVMRMSH